MLSCVYIWNLTDRRCPVSRANHLSAIILRHKLRSFWMIIARYSCLAGDIVRIVWIDDLHDGNERNFVNFCELNSINSFYRRYCTLLIKLVRDWCIDLSIRSYEATQQLLPWKTVHLHGNDHNLSIMLVHSANVSRHRYHISHEINASISRRSARRLAETSYHEPITIGWTVMFGCSNNGASMLALA